MTGPIYPDQTGALARWIRDGRRIDSGRTTQDPAPAPAPPATALEWSSGRDHWNRDPRPCQHCRRPTNLRDEHGLPAHKTCAETAHDNAHRT